MTSKPSRTQIKLLYDLTRPVPSDTLSLKWRNRDFNTMSLRACIRRGWVEEVTDDKPRSHPQEFYVRITKLGKKVLKKHPYRPFDFKAYMRFLEQEILKREERLRNKPSG